LLFGNPLANVSWQIFTGCLRVLAVRGKICFSVKGYWRLSDRFISGSLKLLQVASFGQRITNTIIGIDYPLGQLAEGIDNI
jgi:hypothetical protein